MTNKLHQVGEVVCIDSGDDEDGPHAIVALYGNVELGDILYKDTQQVDAVDWNALRHSANEWADMATNGLQWLRNIVDGISDPKEALDNMESNLKHCRAVNDAPAVQNAIRVASQKPVDIPGKP